MSLTETQKNVLRWLVEEVGAGNLDEEQIWCIWSHSGVNLVGYKGSVQIPDVKTTTLDALEKNNYISCDRKRSGEYRFALTGEAYKAVESNFAEPDRSANYYLNSPTEMMNFDPLKVWQEKLNYFQYQEAIAADPAQKFSLAQQIEECKRKISELSSITDR
ncbi:hypothetical protein V0288_22820 [Pannus brasiliensis CCIBt3594]|uniref:Uncharacterized protein n=1 Tax=Pannus brasiliensis CCIBt3594 TaxID=1427578 RepID=A0AAW9R1R5_9CHRO